MIDFKDAAQYQYLWNNNGHVPESGDVMSVKDALSVPNAPLLMPKVISNIVREAIEPMLVGTSLLQRIGYKYGQTITLPATGALQAADIPEGGEYPEVSMDQGGATVTANIGKSGLAVKITEEMIRYSQFDIIGMHLRQAGWALGRHKEEKIFNLIRNEGTIVFDNLKPAQSMLGVLHGRSLDGSGNGSISADDVFDTYAHIIAQGFIPDTLLMHPLTWTMFMKDATLRHFVNNSGTGTYFATTTGNPISNAWGNANQGGQGPSAGQSIVEPGTPSGLAPSGTPQYHPNNLTSAPVMPSYFGGGFRIIVSPYVPFDAVHRLTDIYMADSRNLGLLIVDEEVGTEEFNDPSVDIRKIKVRERYALAILNEGHGVGVMRNVHVVPNEIVLPAQANIDVTGSITEIGPTDNVLS